MKLSPEFTVLIPARLASTRLPNKPLADIAGLPMIVRVAQRAQQSAAARVVVAADDMRIVQACRRHAIEALLTQQDHPSGSDRLAEACVQLGLTGDELVVNVQGDEPLIAPDLINSVALALASHPGDAMSTAAHPILDSTDFANPNVVKVVCAQDGRAMYFSRAPIPHWRDQPVGQAQVPEALPLRHVGVYAYRAAFLRAFPGLVPAPIERTEALEQLRALWHGAAIRVVITAHAPAPGVDTPADLERVRAILAAQNQPPV